MQSPNLIVLSADSPVTFPDPTVTMSQPEGLLCVGGNLMPETLVSAYCMGVFPWFSDDQPILWWSPETRAVFTPSNIHVSKNMKKLYRQQKYEILFDHDFRAVIERCSKRIDGADTWIVEEVIEAYAELARMGIAHSVEVYDGPVLIGGLYGVFIKNVFCGESMFSARPNTSKLALFELANFLGAYGCHLIDCQLVNDHLVSLGAVAMPRATFLTTLAHLPKNEVLIGSDWSTLDYRREVIQCE